MVWYRWKFWRLARGYPENGTYCVWDGDGRWEHIGRGFFWLVEVD